MPLARFTSTARALVGAALGLLAAAPLAAQQKVSRGHAATSTVSVRFYGDVDGVRIVGWERDSVLVLGALPAGARFEASWGGSGSEPSSGAKMFVEAPARGAAPGARGRLELRVPMGARVWAKTGSATIEVSRVTGGLDLNVVGGAIRVDGSPRELRAESMDGSVTVTGAPEWMRVRTATGAIDVRGGGSDLGLATVSGDIQARAGRYERLRVETVTGDMTFAGSLAAAGSLEVDSHSGGVELQLGVPVDIELDIRTLTGRIENRVTSHRPVPGREGRGMELSSPGGRNAARIAIRSFKGDVRLLPVGRNTALGPR